ncbi:MULTISPECIES: hypothetical protein [Geobacillus]|uniref:Uncharacterized protein n=1 Tax=Geobacillus thermocatenulatus TaxID=33938 RepID=A0A226Q8V4_9BACL|nr:MULTISPECIES: hypothetical protein [Geobacillus]ASS98102.1 hypothetical protein GT3921_02950 [Geobacillus thermocatenulatus]KPC99174.1 hypothetical protein LR69_02591 [Geobacillus sp. BCO2]RAN22234.1 hypothetical protein VC88_12140 [Geobacillus sp. A8]KLR74430.1 hypothetical protein ABH20_05430 [Geobacillus sp. T6]OXB88846.1 hypothetical protein B9L19_01665 [Geobacillus thermocatenulatus]
MAEPSIQVLEANQGRPKRSGAPFHLYGCMDIFDLTVLSSHDIVFIGKNFYNILSFVSEYKKLKWRRNRG